MDEKIFATLEEYLLKIPAVKAPIAKGFDDKRLWWVKFSIDIEDPLAWNVVQELAHVLNYLSLDDRLPVLFMPVSPPPYMNGGPIEFLSWVIECKNVDFHPNTCMQWLEGRLPNPVDDLNQWNMDE